MNKTKTILRLALKTAELYQDGGWRSLSIAGTHDGAFSVKLADGRYMVGGGFSKQGGVGQSAATDIYDPQTHAFSAGPQLTQARAQAKAVGTGTLVYVSGNWYTADKVMDRYDGSSFQAVGDMDGRSNPYLMADAEGNLLVFSAYNTEGRSFGFHTYDDGSTGLLADRYLASTGQTKYLGLPFTPQICPTALPDDMRSEDYHVIFNGHNCYLILAESPKTTITLVFKKVKSSLPGPETYKVSFKIKQKAAIAKVDKDRLHFFGNGGSDQVKIDFGIYPYCGAYVSGKADPEDHEMVKMPVAIVQDGSTIIPDGDNSPFKMVNFWMTRKIDYVVDGDEGNVGTTELNQQFTFYPNNSHFTLKREKGYIHVECEGLAENATSGKTKASLKFDIYGSDKTVRNLQFRSDTHATTSVYMMGYQATMTSDVEVKVATGSLPLSTYTATYMECPKYKVSDGLVFTSFSGTGHSVATCVPYAEMSIIISGRLTGQTISDLYFAILKTDSPGVHCIMKDYDGTSAKTTWSPPADN